MRVIVPLLALAIAGCDPPAPVTPPPHVSTAPPGNTAGQETKGTPEAVEAMRGKWTFKEGSWIEHRVTVQKPKAKETYNRKVTVQKLTEEKVKLLYQEQGGRQREGEVSLAPSMKKTGTETLDVDGKVYECTIYEDVEKIGAGIEKTKQWICKDAPGRIVRYEQVRQVGDIEVKGSGGLRKLGQRFTLGQHTLTYATWELSAKYPTGGEETITRWVSDQVPGFIIREEHRRKVKDAEELQVTELVDFEVK